MEFTYDSSGIQIQPLGEGGAAGECQLRNILTAFLHEHKHFEQHSFHISREHLCNCDCATLPWSPYNTTITSKTLLKRQTAQGTQENTKHGYVGDPYRGEL